MYNIFKFQQMAKSIHIFIWFRDAFMDAVDTAFICNHTRFLYRLSLPIFYCEHSLVNLPGHADATVYFTAEIAAHYSSNLFVPHTDYSHQIFVVCGVKNDQTNRVLSIDFGIQTPVSIGTERRRSH